MLQPLQRATKISLISNILLFIVKAAVGIISNSIAVISDAVNSLTDIISSSAILYSVRVSLKKADEDHQFGHSAAQPLAAFIIALFAAIVGINIIEESIKRIIEPRGLNISTPVFVVLGATIIVKLILTNYQSRVGKVYKSPALRASAVDSLNDVLASSLAVIGVVGAQIGYPFLDGAAGIFIAFFIFRSGYSIAKENIDYLMGRAADERLIMEIANIALKIDGVQGLNELKSHYVGDKFHIEIHIDVDKHASTEKSHDIGKEVQKRILNLPEISKVFVHIDPI